MPTFSAVLRARLTCSALVLLAACAAPRTPSHSAQIDALAARIPQYRYVLLGEVHDNAVGHALRREALMQALASGWRPVLAMEQFDRENQPLLDQAMRRCTDAACVVAIAAPGSKGWEWAYYEPMITLALKYRLPIVAANLSRRDAARGMRQGLDAVFSAEQLRALSLAGDVDPALLAAQQAEVAQAHCGMLPEPMLRPMAMAQIARDATMAQVMRDASAKRAGNAEQGAAAGLANGVAEGAVNDSVNDPVAGTVDGGARVAGVAQGMPVVLLAGNGHVRKQLGVPYWLWREQPQAQAQPAVLAVGFVESGAPTGTFDEQIRIPPADRPDPCASFRPPPPVAR